MTLTLSACASPPPPLLTRSPVLSHHHIMIRWYVAITLMSRHIPWCQVTLSQVTLSQDSIYLDVKTLIISSYRDALMRLFIWGGDIHSRKHSRQHHGIIHSNMISQYPWSIDKHLPDSLNIRCSARCLRQQAVEQYMAMVWAAGREGFNELRIERLNAGWFGGMALDVVFWGVASLNKVSIVENMEGIGWNVANTWAETIFRLIENSSWWRGKYVHISNHETY